MEKIYIGKIVSTHGIKGELKIISDFPYKEKVFYKDNYLLIDNKRYQIRTYRYHKIYDMITLDEYKNINEVEHLLNKKVYINKDDLILDGDEILDSDLIKFKVFLQDDTFYDIIEIFKASPTNKVVRFKIDDKIAMFPLNNKNIKIDKKRKGIYLNKEDVIII